MGKQMDLASLIGLPTEQECPLCKKEKLYLWFDDYDLDSRKDTEPGVFTLKTECQTCKRKVTVVCRTIPHVEYISVGELINGYDRREVWTGN